MASIDIETMARLARTVSGLDRPYLYCRVVPLLAEASPQESEWVLGYVRALLRLGLSRAAGDLVHRFDSSIRSKADVAALALAMGDGGGGRIAWTSRRRRFEANIEALASRDRAAADAIAEAWAERCDRFELHLCSDGNVQVRDALSVWPARWLPSLDDHRALAAGRVNTERVGILPPPMLFEGLGLGWEAIEGYRRTRRVFLNASAAIYIVEPHAEAAAIAFHVQDWRELLKDASVQWFIGDDARERLGRLLAGEAAWPVTDRYCCTNLIDGHSKPPATTIMAAVSDRRVKRISELHSELLNRFSWRDADWFGRRFHQAMDDNGSARSGGLRILGVTSIHTTFLQYSMRDCLAALEELGHQTRMLIEPDHHLHLDTTTALEAQLEFEPDLVLLLSRMRYEMPTLIHESIPTVTWDQDSLPWVFDGARRPQLAWNDFLMGFSAISARGRFGWPEHRCMHCAMAGSPGTYSAQPLADEVLEAFRCDVSYVSHASAPVEQEIKHAAGWLADERLRRIYRVVVERMLPQWTGGGAFPGRTMTVLLDCCESMGESLDRHERASVAQAVQRIGDRAFRHAALEWVADWADRTGRKFFLWGNGWDSHPRFRRFAHGPTQNGQELRAIYQASRINLQLMGFGFLHQRALDGLMAGAFFMGRRSSADTQGPAVRALADAAERFGISRAADVEAIDDPLVRRHILSLCDGLNVDMRAWDSTMSDQLHASASGDFAGDIIPHFDEISFDSAEEFARRADRFLGDESIRTVYSHRMRDVLLDRYSYRTRMAQMLRFVRDGFDMEAPIGARSGQLISIGADS